MSSKIPCRTKKTADLEFIVEALAFDLVYEKLPRHITLFEGVKNIHFGRFLESPKGYAAKEELKADLMRIIRKYIRQAKL